MYAVVGYFAHALNGFLEFDENLCHGVFMAKERVVIEFAVSATNVCDYFLARQTQALKKGFSLEEAIAVLEGELADNKLNGVMLLAKSIVETSSTLKNELLQTFYSFGYNEAALVELIGLVAITIYKLCISCNKYTN